MAEARPARAPSTGGEPGSEALAERLARYYDLDLVDETEDIGLYLALAERTGGPIVELAAGSGRIAVPLALAGWPVTGIDLDPAMLARAERRWATECGAAAEGGDLSLLTADLLEAPATGRFALAILGLNSLLLLGTAERQASAVRHLAGHLQFDALAVVDVLLPGPEELVAYDGRLLVDWERADPATGDRVTKLSSARHDPATATVELRTWFDAWPAAGGPVGRTGRVDRLRLVGADELAGWLVAAGLQIETLAADPELRPFGPGAERLIAIARRPRPDRDPLV